MVIADMHARDDLGRARYGTPLQPHNGRDALQDAYEEALDLCVYLRQAIEERRMARADAALAELRRINGGTMVDVAAVISRNRGAS